MSKIKICGIYRKEDALLINKYRPDYFGMIIGFEKSHRNIDEKKAGMLRSMVSADIGAVGVFVDEDNSKIERLLNDGVIDIAQLHGNESDEQILDLKERTGKSVWKAFKIKNPYDLDKARLSRADLVLLDNGYGTGECFNWDIVCNFDRPFALAGGLNESNTEKAIKTMKPYLYDISSGAETDKVKDENKIKRIIEIVRGIKNDRCSLSFKTNADIL